MEEAVSRLRRVRLIHESLAGEGRALVRSFGDFPFEFIGPIEPERAERGAVLSIFSTMGPLSFRSMPPGFGH